MPLVHIKSPELSSAQKMRLGERIIAAFHEEGIPAGSMVVLFEKEQADLFLDGGLLFEAQPAPLPRALPVAVPVLPPEPPPPPAEPSGDFRNKVRRNKAELQELKNQLVARLQAKGVLSSFQAQVDLGLKSCEWAPATLRRFFSELEEEGVIAKQGQKRGTRYVWQGMTTQQAGSGQSPRLVKRAEDEGGR